MARGFRFQVVRLWATVIVYMFFRCPEATPTKALNPKHQTLHPFLGAPLIHQEKSDKTRYQISRRDEVQAALYGEF